MARGKELQPRPLRPPRRCHLPHVPVKRRSRAGTMRAPGAARAGHRLPLGFGGPSKPQRCAGGRRPRFRQFDEATSQISPLLHLPSLLGIRFVLQGAQGRQGAGTLCLNVGRQSLRRSRRVPDFEALCKAPAWGWESLKGS